MPSSFVLRLSVARGLPRRIVGTTETTFAESGCFFNADKLAISALDIRRHPDKSGIEPKRTGQNAESNREPNESAVHVRSLPLLADFARGR